MINTIFETLASLYDCVLCAWFITRFNGAKFSPKKNKYLAVFFVIYVGITAISDIFLPGFSTLSSLLLLALSCIYAFFISEKHIFRAILSACLFKAAVIVLSSSLFLAASMIVKDFDVLMQGSGYAGRYIMVLLHKIFLFAVLKMFLFIFKTDTSMDVKSIIITALFTLTTIVGLGAAMSVTAYPAATEIQLQVFIITASLAAVNVFLYILIFQIQKLQKTKYELKLLENKMRFEDDRYRDANAIWNNIKKIQHDMKQHLTVIDGLICSGKTEECRDYVEELLPEVNRVGALISTGNTILDYLINSKLCQLKNTQVVISGSAGDLSDIKGADLACLMGNILDNAVEAIENLEEKRIELLFMKQNSNRIIICKNTVGESVLGTNKEFKTTKSGGDHGFGHSIIEKIVSDYNGMIDYFEETDMFGVQVVLPVILK